eukprot:6478298-Amphidinium_carterae.1
MVARRCTMLKQQKNHATLIEVVDPFQSSKQWDSKLPLLAGIGCAFAEKLATCTSTLFNELLQEYVVAGETWVSEVNKFCRMLLGHWDKAVDPLNLEYSEKRALDACKLVCNAMLAIVADDVDMSALELT